jgi:predicted Fe-S protein YdhL (DUF1289 family)
MAAQEYAKGVCPDCGRTVSGRATGIEYDHGDRRFVLLRPHNRAERARHPVVCLSRGGRRVVPRVRD